MRLLRRLTLIYSAVLVSAVGASLAAIWIYLRRIAGTLDRVGMALARVSEQTGPLAGQIQPVQDVSGDAAAALAEVNTIFGRAGEHLGAIAEQHGKGDGAA